MSTQGPFEVLTVAKSAWFDFSRSRVLLIAYSVGIKLAEAWLIVPVIATGLAFVLSMSGHMAVSNWDAVDFLLSPMGLVYIVFLGVVTVVLFLFEQAGIMGLATLAESIARPTLKQYAAAAFPQPRRVAEMGLVILALLLLALIPLGLLLLLTYRVFLYQHDINYYVTEKPIEFWWAVICGGTLVLVAAAAGIALYVRWSLALPILLFEPQSTLSALGASRDRLRGTKWRVGIILSGWLITALLLGIALETGFRVFAGYVLDRAGEQPLIQIFVLLAAQTALVATWSFITVTGLCLVTRQIYLRLNETKMDVQPGISPPSTEPMKTKSFNGKLVALIIALLLFAPLALWSCLTRFVADRPPVRVTAHRGHSLAAPENTISAVRKAIESGADYAEIDVLMTTDGVVVLLHDSDLKRVAADERRISDITYEDLQKLDVGSWFGAEFVGERAPTLAEVMQFSKGRIKLNIELKVYDPDPRLVPEITRLIRECNFESECIVTTFKYDSLLEAKRLNPQLRTGLIVAHALGDISRLDVDLFSIRANWLTDPVLRQAHRQGKEVHVWTVNDAAGMYRLMKRGVDNIITDDPDLLIQVRNDWSKLAATERLLLASRLLLGLEP